MQKFTKDNNLLIATIHFMNEANYQNAFSGIPVVMKGFTGQQVREKCMKARLGIPVPTKFHSKTSSGLTPSVGMRHPEKRTGRRQFKALLQITKEMEANNG